MPSAVTNTSSAMSDGWTGSSSQPCQSNASHEPASTSAVAIPPTTRLVIAPTARKRTIMIRPRASMYPISPLSAKSGR